MDLTRRGFIVNGAAAAITLALAKSGSEQAMADNMPAGLPGEAAPVAFI